MILPPYCCPLSLDVRHRLTTFISYTPASDCHYLRKRERPLSLPDTVFTGHPGVKFLSLHPRSHIYTQRYRLRHTRIYIHTHKHALMHTCVHYMHVHMDIGCCLSRASLAVSREVGKFWQKRNLPRYRPLRRLGRRNNDGTVGHLECVERVHSVYSV